MTEKPDLATEQDMTPEGIAANTFFSKQEKLDRLNAMKTKLGEKADDGSASLAQVEKRMAAINTAISQVKNSGDADDGGVVMGRASSA
ncbi:hypothetical protein [Oricola cellulosilytica]|uniref:Uncharacterized protein n=1 Tax=Oricola cellulosilytica TaxID=1429082 RepID=A0A4R0PER0_9HYPH|nr:hypothetical protein [Oricola cellulosilytica]TCD16081.1 hypothetical protein E0D97_01170 [Oricola cellulosilytica]